LAAVEKRAVQLPAADGIDLLRLWACSDTCLCCPGHRHRPNQQLYLNGVDTEPAAKEIAKFLHGCEGAALQNVLGVGDDDQGHPTGIPLQNSAGGRHFAAFGADTLDFIS